MSNIQKILVDMNLCVFNFYENELERLYQPKLYTENQEKFGYRYSVVVDQNIFQQIISIGNGKQIDQRRKYAISFIVFCQLANIDIDPTMAIYEKMRNPKTDDRKVLEELRRFDQINHANTDELNDLLCGKKNSLNLPKVELRDDNLLETLRSSLPLKSWKSMYLITLKIVEIQERQIGNRSNKIKELCDWMRDQFLFSQVGLIFLAVLVGKQQVNGHYKFKKDASIELRKMQLENMAWDLYYCNSYLSEWKKDELNHYKIYCSEDKAILEILRTSITLQLQMDYSSLEKYIDKNDVNSIKEASSIIGSLERKNLISELFTKRDNMIFELESKLLQAS